MIVDVKPYPAYKDSELMGKVGLFEGADSPVTFASYLVRMRPRPHHEPAYLNTVLNDSSVLSIARREAIRLDPILDACVAVYRGQLDEDARVDFKGKAKAFGRTYGFLATILPYTNAAWEKLSIFLNFLVPKLPAPTEPPATAETHALVAKGHAPISDPLARDNSHHSEAREGRRRAFPRV